MSFIKYEENYFDLDFDGFLLIHTEDLFNFYRNKLLSKIKWAFNSYSSNNEIYITPITKFAELFSLNKSSLFIKLLQDKLQNQANNIFNEAFWKQIEQLLEEKFVNLQLVDNVEFQKILSIIIDIDKEKIITKSELIYYFDLLKKYSTKDILVIFDHDNIDENVIEKIISNKIEMVFITNSIRKWKKIIDANLDNVIFFNNKHFYKPTIEEVETKQNNLEIKTYVKI